jgi:hypothetical protein
MNDQATAAPTRAEHQARMADYLKAGEARARSLGNKGPVRFDADGNLHPDIVAAYWKHGFYIFEGVIGSDEIAALRADALNMLERAPALPGGKLDTQGRPAMGRDWAREPFTFIKPLSDPWGGTDKLNGRHPSKMPEAVPLICNAGEVTMVNRQCLHGSFANSSPDIRISLTFGFHRRRSVLGAKAGLSMTQQNVVYDEQRIFERAAVIPIAIDARHQHYPAETPYKYQPFADRASEFRYIPETCDRWIKDYNTKDLAI